MTQPDYALLFPGQGAQFPGMAQRLHDRSEAVRDLFDRAEERTRLSLRRLCFSTDRTAASRTDWTQPAVFVASLASWTHLREQQLSAGRPADPAVVAGHSLGHFAALVAAGAICLDDALDLVQARGEIMHRSGSGGMMTIVGLALEVVRGALATLDGATISIAAVNGPDQTVVAGEQAALDRVAVLAESLGAQRVVPLYIGLAAHTTLMESAAIEFAALVDRLQIAIPASRIALNTTGALTQDPEEVRRDLRQHIMSPVLWWQMIMSIRSVGVERLVDAGPGRTLAKMLGRDLPPQALHALDQPRGLDGLLK